MSFKPLRAIVSLVASLASLYVIYGTYGTALATFQASGYVTLSHLTMAGSWLAICTTALNNFDALFSSVWVIAVSIIVYTVLSLFTSTDYDRAANG